MRLQTGVALIVLVLAAWGPADGAVVHKAASAKQAFAQVEKPRVTQRVRQWTRARLEAAKKRWARNNSKFSTCANELAEVRKTRRVSVHDQGHFLQDCMRRP
jgi:hypothetical protein